ncbi:hypothetical protein WMF27_20255 [Sorangium sp. So ce281]|uniref:hypothetical protein n=1 Tax=unclassified Sorangium TaxID=2621164 RepID=UPI003F62A959
MPPSSPLRSLRKSSGIALALGLGRGNRDLGRVSACAKIGLGQIPTSQVRRFIALALPFVLLACRTTGGPAASAENASGGDASTGGAGAGGTASAGASGGAGGAASGGAASGGANGSGGAQPDPDGAGEEFLLSFPRRNAFGLGQPLAATPDGSVVTVGARAPAELLPDSIGEPFLAEYSATGEVLHALALPGAAEPELMAIDAEGSIFLVGQLYMDMTFGEFTLTAVEEGFYLVKVNPDFSIALAAGVTLEGSSPLSTMAVDADGDVVVGLGVYNDDASVQKPRIMKFSGSTLKEIWSTTFEHDISQGYTIALTFNRGGEILAGGAFTGRLTIGGTELEKAGGQDDPAVYNGWLAWLDPESGDPLRALRFGGASFDYVKDLKSTASGRLLLLASQTSTSTFLDHTDTFDEKRSESVLYDFEDGETVRWASRLGGPDYYGNALALGGDGQSYVAGRFGWLGTEEDAKGGRLTRFAADGAKGESVEFATGNPNGLTHVAVDTKGGVWVSGAWETAFDFSGKSYAPPTDGGQFVLRKKGF